MKKTVFAVAIIVAAALAGCHHNKPANGDNMAGSGAMGSGSAMAGSGDMGSGAAPAGSGM